MKKKGSVSEFGTHRDQELQMAYDAALRNSHHLPGDDIYRCAADTPTSRFWVSERRASEVLAKMEKGESIGNMRPERQEMYKELFRRFSELRSQKPRPSIYEAAYRAVNSPAPGFYLTPSSVKVMIYNIAKKLRRKGR